MKRLIAKLMLTPEDIHVIDTKSGGNIVYVVAYYHNGFEGFDLKSLAETLQMQPRELQILFVQQYGGKADGTDVTFNQKPNAQSAADFVKGKLNDMSSGK
jgi:hypothetical protein